MSVDLAHSDAWSIDDLYELPENGMRHELLDGSLLVTPAPGVGHQVVCSLLWHRLHQEAPPAWVPLPGVGVQIPSGLLIPDIVVISRAEAEREPREVDCGTVALAIEVESPFGRRRDRVWKPEAYAEAGIPRYWRVTPDAEGGPQIAVYALVEGSYSEQAVVLPGAPAELSAPFPVTVDPGTLCL
jgi:Uma2 family endonuclease